MHGTCMSRLMSHVSRRVSLLVHPGVLSRLADDIGDGHGGGCGQPIQVVRSLLMHSCMHCMLCLPVSPSCHSPLLPLGHHPHSSLLSLLVVAIFVVLGCPADHPPPQPHITTLPIALVLLSLAESIALIANLAISSLAPPGYPRVGLGVDRGGAALVCPLRPISPIVVLISLTISLTISLSIWPGGQSPPLACPPGLPPIQPLLLPPLSVLGVCLLDNTGLELFVFLLDQEESREGRIQRLVVDDGPGGVAEGVAEHQPVQQQSQESQPGRYDGQGAKQDRGGGLVVVRL